MEHDLAMCSTASNYPCARHFSHLHRARSRGGRSEIFQLSSVQVAIFLRLTGATSRAACSRKFSVLRATLDRVSLHHAVLFGCL